MYNIIDLRIIKDPFFLVYSKYQCLIDSIDLTGFNAFYHFDNKIEMSSYIYNKITNKNNSI